MSTRRQDDTMDLDQDSLPTIAQANNPTVETDFWSELNDSLKLPASSEARMEALLAHVEVDRVIDKWVDTTLSDQEKLELTGQLDTLFKQITSDHLRELDENARGKLLYIKKKLQLSAPEDRVFGEQGRISRQRELDIKEKTRAFVEAIDNDLELVASLKQLDNEEKQEWGAKEKKSVTQKMMNHLANAYGLNSRLVKLDTSIPDIDSITLADVDDSVYPPHMNAYPDLFKAGSHDFISTFAHEGIHMLQAEIRYQVRSKNTPKPEFDLENDELNNQFSAEQGTTHQVTKLDKYGANINASDFIDTPTTHQFRYAINREREGYAAEIASMMWLARSNNFKDQNSFFAGIDPNDPTGLMRSVETAIKDQIEMSLKQILERPNLIEPADPHNVTSSGDAMEALWNFAELRDDNDAADKMLCYAMLNSFPKLSEINQDVSHPLNRQAKLINQMIVLPYGAIQDQLFGNPFKFPSDEAELEGMKSSLQKLAISYPDELCREILYGMICAYNQRGDLGPIEDTIKQIIFNAPVLSPEDFNAIGQRTSSNQFNPPKLLGNEQYVAPFYQRGTLCLAEATTRIGVQKTERSFVVIHSTTDYQRLGKTPAEIAEYIQDNGNKSRPNALKVTPLSQAAQGVGVTRRKTMTR